MKTIHFVFGSQGAGKSTYAKQLAKEVNGVHLAIDEWMWELFGADLPQPINMAWVMERVARCEKRIWANTLQIIATGTPAILDLGFMKAQSRQLYNTLAANLNIPVQWHYVDAPVETRLQRVINRNAEKGNTFSFEVSPEAFHFMESQFERPTEEELAKALVISTHLP
ncbi:MAG: ATP-binding protein [Chitinophagaceae bacterium]|nr:MAG: ATP-binding protein [Chitinophagaceae bacterium]